MKKVCWHFLKDWWSVNLVKSVENKEKKGGGRCLVLYISQSFIFTTPFIVMQNLTITADFCFYLSVLTKYMWQLERSWNRGTEKVNSSRISSRMPVNWGHRLVQHKLAKLIQFLLVKSRADKILRVLRCRNRCLEPWNFMSWGRIWSVPP